MKHVFLMIVVAIASLLSTDASAAKVGIQMKGDSAMIVDGKDTVTVTSSVLKSISQRIDERLNDTVLSNESATAIDNADARNEAAMNQREIERMKYDQEQSQSMQHTAIVLVQYIGGVIAVIVALCLFAYYMHRRAKYKVISKAIENNYPLPEGIFGNRVATQQPIVVQQPSIPTVPGQMYQPQQPSQQPGQQPAYQGDIYQSLRWNKSARSGGALIMIGLCILIFACVVQEEFFLFVSLVFLLIGAVKFVLAYYDIRHSVYSIPQQPVTPQEQPQQPQTPQQPITPQEPQQPTPPPFNSVNSEQ